MSAKPSKTNKRQKPFLRITKISKNFDTITALKSVSLQVKPGTIHAVLGPNGSGKTTLLRSLSGLIQPDNGSVYISDLRVTGVDITIRKKMAIVPDEDDLIDDVTPFEYLLFVAALYELDSEFAHVRIEQLLKLVELWDVRDRLCRGFSHGMRKKVQIVAALLPQAPLFVIDEPTNGLDPDVIVLLKEVLIGLKRNGHAVLLATHNLDFAQAIADDVTLLSKKVFATGSVRQILRLAKTERLENAYMQLTNKRIDYEAIKTITAHS
jgi:ABC-type multidrug transport system ATPase subunit